MAENRKKNSKDKKEMRPGMKHVFSSSGSGLRELLNGIFYNYRLLFFTFLTPIILSSVFATTLKTIYSAESRLLVLLSREHVIGEGGLNTAGFGGSLNMQARIVKAESEILLSHKLRSSVVRKIGPTVLYSGLDADDFDGQKTGIVQAAADLLGNDLVINLSSTSDIIHLEYEHEDPYMAAELVNTVVDTYLEQRGDIFASEGVIVLENRLKEFEMIMADLDYRIGEQRRRLNIYDYAAEMQVLLRRLAELKNKQLASEIAIEGLTARSSELNLLKDIIPEEVFSGWSDDGALNALNSAINQRNALLLEKTALANTYKSGSRFITNINKRLDEANKLVEDLEELEIARQRTGRNLVYDNVLQQLIGLQAQLRQEEAVWDAQSIAIEQVYEQLAELEVAETEYKQMMLEQKTVLEKIGEYEIRLEKERLANLLENQHDDPTIRIIERAVPNTDGASSYIQVIVIGFICSFVFSLAAVYLSSISRTIMVTPEEAERTLEIPVLISIGLKT